LVRSSALPQQLELRAHGRNSGCATWQRARVPCRFANRPRIREVQHGDLLLLNGTVMLRFEEGT